MAMPKVCISGDLISIGHTGWCIKRDLYRLLTDTNITSTGTETDVPW